MNIYDFDKTIYDGDSSIDFFKYSILKNKKNLFLVPSIGITYILYLLKLKDKATLKSKFFSVVKNIENIDEVIEEFWEKHSKKIKKFYIDNHQSEDIIISASPEFLLKGICDKLDVNLIASNFDKKTGALIGNNCYGDEKVRRLKEIGIERCDKFYSDSKSDTPLKLIAKEAFLVHKETIKEWK